MLLLHFKQLMEYIWITVIHGTAIPWTARIPWVARIADIPQVTCMLVDDHVFVQFAYMDSRKLMNMRAI
jgi:hypothetical protein